MSPQPGNGAGLSLLSCESVQDAIALCTAKRAERIRLGPKRKCRQPQPVLTSNSSPIGLRVVDDLGLSTQHLALDLPLLGADRLGTCVPAAHSNANFLGGMDLNFPSLCPDVIPYLCRKVWHRRVS